jgi:hypothetical protein
VKGVRAREWVGRVGVGKKSYFQRTNYVRWPVEEKPPKIVQFSAAVIAPPKIGYNFR